MAYLVILIVMVTSLPVAVTGEKCDESFTAVTGSFYSRSYLNGYGVKQKCAWTIQVKEDSVIELVLKPTTHYLWKKEALACESGRIEVYDVQADGSRYLKNSWCGKSAPHNYISTTNKIAVEFVPTLARRSLDFTVAWSTPVAICQESFTNDTGSIQLSEFLSTKTTSCRWNLKVEDGYVIDLRINGNLQQWCDHSIKVFEVFSNRSRVEPTNWCTSNFSPLWISSRPEIEIEYHVKQQSQGAEFSISWSKEEKSCHKSLDGPTGTITYSGGFNCKWYIAVEDTKLINLNFDPKFKVGNGDGESCDDDNIEIFDILGNSSMKRLGQWCGSQAPPLIKSMGSRVMVVLHSDHSGHNNNHSFSAVWDTDDECSGHFTNAEGSLYSPNFPYTSSLSCEWTIEAGDGYLIKADFAPFNDGHSHDECNYDQSNTEISLVQSTGKRILMPNLCWKDVNEEQIYYASSRIHIKYKSSTTEPERFALSWQRSEQPSCGGIFEGVEGEIASQNYPSKYSDNLDCKWEFVAPFDQHVTLEFNNFDLGTKDNISCKHDRIEIFDVLGDNSLVSRGKWCATDKPPKVNSLGSRLVVTFVTDKDGGNNGLGFSASWLANDNCGGTFTPKSDTGLLFTSNYPHRLAQSKSCVWTMSVGKDDIIALKYNPPYPSFTSYACLSERVEVSDILASEQSNERVTWCASTNPQDVVSAYSALDTVVSTTSKVSVNLQQGSSQAHSLSWFRIGPDDDYTCQENQVCRFKGRTFYKCSCDFKPTENDDGDSIRVAEIAIIIIGVIIGVMCLCALFMLSRRQPPVEKYYS